MSGFFHKPFTNIWQPRDDHIYKEATTSDDDPREGESMRRIFFIVATILGVALSARGEAPAGQQLQGIFRGAITLIDGGRQIPLALSLAMTDRQVPSPNDSLFDEQRYVQGSLILDDEGGIYALNRVEFNLEQGQIDLQYARSNGQLTFRLKGSLNGNGTITGVVNSATHGEIGSFSVAYDPDATVFTAVPKYVGKWSGKMKHTDGSELPIRLTVNPSSAATSPNPPDAEFDYTPGRNAGIKLDILDIPMQSLTIDYVNRVMTMAHDAGNGLRISIILAMNPDGSLKGEYIADQGGRLGTITMQKVE